MPVRKNGHLKSAVARPLARPGDPYINSRGARFEPEVYMPDMDEAPIAPVAKEFKSSKRKTMREMPAPVSVMNGIACVFAYTIMGLGDREMADALKITTEHIKKLREHTAYSEYFQAVFHEFINANAETVHARLASYGHFALTNIHTIAKGAKKEETRLTANRDLMDRGGWTARNNLERANGMSKGDLRIVHVKIGDGIDVKVSAGLDN